MNQLPSSRQTPRSQFLKVAEYTATAASVMGVVVSAVSQQVIYATAPLSLSLCLNLVNRRRFEQQTQRQFNDVIAVLDQRLVTLPSSDNTALIEQIAQLQQRLAAIETAEQTEVRSRLDQFAEQFAELQQRQNTQQTELQSQLTQVQAQLLQAIELIDQQVQAALETQSQTISRSRPEETAEVRSQLSQLAEQFAALQQRQTTDQTALQTRLAQLQERLSQEIAAIQAQIQARPTLDHLETLRQALSGLEARINQLQMQFTTIEESQAIVIEDRLPPIEPPPVLEEPETPELTPDSAPEVIPQTPDRPSDGETIDLEIRVLNLGIDFGTSFTKVCFYDLISERSEVVTFTDGEVDVNEALLPTKIAILPDGTLITGLTASEWQNQDHPEQTIIEFIKMRLAAFDLPLSPISWQLAKIPEVSQAEAIEDLCAYYLSRVITRAQAWIRRNKPELLLNQKIEWSANVGVPVEYCDSKVKDRFEKVLSLAWLLSNKPQTEAITLQNLHAQLQPLRAKLETTEVDCHAVPEIAAEVWSLINSREADTGFYILFDVGDGTLDGCSFRYWNDQGEKKVDFYFGKVDPLGVSALSRSLAQELEATEIDVKETICGQSSRFIDRIQTSKTRKAIQKLVANVVLEGTNRYREHGFQLTPHGSRRALDIRIGGGGGQTSFYQKAIANTHQDFQHGRCGIPGYQLKSLPAPRDLDTNGIDSAKFYRFAVAYGLSIPEGEQPEIRLPSEMEQNKPNLSRSEDPMGKPPSYEDMRGA